MNTRFRALGLLGAIVIVGAIIGASSMRATAAGDSDTQMVNPTTVQNLLLVYEVTGNSFGGPIHLRLSVYDSGQASISAAGFLVEDPPSEGCPNNGKAEYTFVGVEEARALMTALRNAGAYQAGSGGFATDSPLTTISVFRNHGGQSTAHTFSFYVANGPVLLDTVDVIDAFIDAHFPDF